MSSDHITWAPRYNHVGIAVPVRDPLVDKLLHILGGKLVWRDYSKVGPAGFRASQMMIGGHKLEVIDPDRPGGFLDGFLSRRGPGLHHITWYVADMMALVAHFERTGAKVVDREWRRGQLVNAFVHPKSAHGVLLQFRPYNSLAGFRKERYEATRNLPPGRPSRGGPHHVSLAVEDGAAAAKFYQGFLGGQILGPNDHGDFVGHILRLDARPNIGFISPKNETGFVAKFIREKGGGGIHHVTFEMWDMEGAIDAASDIGVGLMSRKPAEGPVRDVFLQPRDMNGALIRLQQSTGDMPPAEAARHIDLQEVSRTFSRA